MSVRPRDLVVTFLLAAAPAQAGVSSVGSWSVLDFETDGWPVATLVLEDRLKSVQLVCSTGEWSVYLDPVPAEDEREYAFTEFPLAFRGADGVRRTLPGDGQEGRTWQSVHRHGLRRRPRLRAEADLRARRREALDGDGEGDGGGDQAVPRPVPARPQVGAATTESSKSASKTSRSRERTATQRSAR